MSSGITNLQLYEWWTAGEKSLEDNVLSSLNCRDEEKKAKTQETLNRFVRELDKRLTKNCFRVKDRFLERYKDWLDKCTFFPPQTSARPSAGRPRTENFEDYSERGKRRKTEELRASTSTAELAYATQMKLRKEGNVEVAKKIVALTTPGSTDDCQGEKNIVPASPQEAAEFLSECELTQQQYKKLRLFCKRRNANIFPDYNLVLDAKKKTYPPIKTSEGGDVRCTLQDLLDHTTRGILETQEEVLVTLSDEKLLNLTMYSKWGCDGSGGFKKHKKAAQESNSLKSEGGIFFTSVAALQLSCHVDNQPECIVWRIKYPGSPKCCRPLHLQNKKETADLTNTEVSEVESEIAALKPTEAEIGGRKVIVTHHLTCSMVDGKVVSTVLGKSMQCCNVCGLPPSQMNSIDKAKNAPVNTSALRFGISPLHALLRFFALVMSLATHIPIKKSRASGDTDKQIMAERKKEIQERFYKEMNLLVDVPQSGGVGTSTTGNTAREAFGNVQKTAEITGVDSNLLQRFNIILQTIRCGFAGNIQAFDAYAIETAELYVKLYGWYYMPSSVHKVLIHGAKIMEATPLPLGLYTEECQEGDNKLIRWYLLHRAYRGDEETENLHVFQRLLFRSDNRTQAASKNTYVGKPLHPEVLALLQSPDAVMSIVVEAHSKQITIDEED